MSISLWLSGFWVCALSLGKVCVATSSLATLPLWTISGTLSQFTGPSSGICPGDGVTFTCVANTTAVAIWRVNLGGDETSCTYIRNSRNTETCGPGGRFTSSVTDVDGDPSNSSLSVDSITSDLSGTSVTCADGNAIIIGSSSICVIGKMECHEKRLVLTKQCCVANFAPRPFHAHVQTKHNWGVGFGWETGMWVWT